MMDVLVLTKFVMRLISVVQLILLQHRMLHPKQDRRWMSVIYYGLVIWNYGLSPDVFFNTLMESPWFLLLNTVSIAASALLLWNGFQGSFANNYLAASLTYISQLLTSLIITTIFNLLGFESYVIYVNDVSQLPMWVVALILTFLGIYWCFRFLERLRPKLEAHKWLVITIGLTNFLSMDCINWVFRLQAVLGAIKIISMPYDTFVRLTMLWGVFLIFCLLVVVTIVLYIRHRINQQKDEMTQQLLQQQYDSYLQLEDVNAILHRQQHDILNHMVALQTMVDSASLTELRHYLQELTKEYSSYKLETHYCDHHAANAILSSKMRQCRQENINAQFSVRLPEKLLIRDIDIVCVFSNLLDNAIESCKKCETARSILLAAGLQGDMLVVTVHNSCNVDSKLQGGTSKSDTSNHGWGLNILQNIANSYNGRFTISQAGETVEASIVLSNL